MTDYDSTLRAARRVGAARADDAQLMALFCDAPLQTLAGAVSPVLVWEGAQRANLTCADLARMCNEDSSAVAELMWV